MRHHNKNRKFGRNKDARQALLRSLAISLIRYGRITTTEAKAKELRPFIEKLVTKSRLAPENISTRRSVISTLMNRNQEAKKLIEEISPKYKDRNGGYTRILKLPQRDGDAAKMALIEFVD
jgi:large subunit ribosomal protein L17